MSIIKVYLNVPLRKVPRCGLFRINRHYYRRGVYSHRSKMYVCWLVHFDFEEHPKMFAFSPSEIVQYYKER